MKHSRLPLRFAIPLTVLACAAVAALVGGILGTRIAREVAVTEGRRESLVRLASSQQTLEAALRRNDEAAVQEHVAGLARDRNVQRAFMVDDVGTVIWSSRLGEVGSASVATDVERDLIARARTTGAPEIAVEAELRRVVSAINIQGRQAGAREVLLVEHDVSGAFSRVQRNSLLALGSFIVVSLLAALIAGQAFNAFVSRRVNRLLAAAAEVAGGNFAVRAQIKGDDEIAAIGTAFDDMVGRLAENRAAARMNEERYRAIFDAASEAIFLAGANGFFEEANSAGRALAGYSPIEVNALRPRDLVVPDDEATELEALYTMTTGTRIVRGSLVPKSGERIPVEVAACALPHGRILALVRDLRPQREAEQLREQLIMQERLAALGTLAASVGHEINNPLTWIIDNLAALEQHMARLPAVERITFDALLRDAKDGADRVRRIVADLNLFARTPRDDDPLTDVDIRALVNLAVHLASPLVRQVASIVVDVGELPKVMGDERRLAQIMLNLLTNAAQAMPPGRPIEQNAIVIKGVVDGGSVVVEVTDNGVGIPASVLSRIFEPFFTTKGPLGGSGLGLSVSRELLARLGGRLDVTSTPGEGTTFRLSLARARQMPAASPATPVGAFVGAGRRRVLVVDDEPLVARVVARRLAAHDVVVAGGVVEGLARCREAEFDCILCDLTMPDGGGEAFYQTLRAERPAAADCVVFMTGGAVNERASAFLESSLRPVLGKPIDMDQLLAAVAGHPASR